MLNLDPSKLLIIAVVAVILLGPDRLPQVARQIGDAWRTFTEYRHRMESQVRQSIPDLPSSAEIARLARSPSALLTHLSNMDATDAGGPTTAPTLDLPVENPPRERAPATLTRPLVIESPAGPADAMPANDPGLN